MNSSNKSGKINDQIILRTYEESQLINITHELLARVKKEDFDNEIVNYYLNYISNQIKSSEISNQILIMTNSFYKNFIKEKTFKRSKTVTNFDKENDFFFKDFVLLILHNSLENYWELVILKYPLAIFNEKFFSEIISNEQQYNDYKDKQFSIISISPSVHIGKENTKKDLNNILQQQIKDLLNEFFYFHYKNMNITNYIRDLVKYNSSRFNLVTFDLDLKKNPQNSGPSILSCLKSIIDDLEITKEDNIEKKDFLTMIGEEYTENIRDIIYNIMNYQLVENKPIETRFSAKPSRSEFIKLDSKENQIDEVSMRIESRDSKNVLNNLLHQIMERKSTNQKKDEKTNSSMRNTTSLAEKRRLKRIDNENLTKGKVDIKESNLSEIKDSNIKFIPYKFDDYTNTIMLQSEFHGYNEKKQLCFRNLIITSIDLSELSYIPTRHDCCRVI